MKLPRLLPLCPPPSALLCSAAALLSCLPGLAWAQLTAYEREDFGGSSFVSRRAVPDLRLQNFNDRASSVVVASDRWEVCEDLRFSGRCVVLRPGKYASLAAMGLNNEISSLRRLDARARVDDDRYAPEPLIVRDFGRQREERLFEADVTSVRAVLGPPQQRCWMEREQVSEDKREANVPGALAGALIGGILGHQIGGGTGRDIATVGGVVAGAAIGSKTGRDAGAPQISSRDVQRCRNLPADADRPAYWDVSYQFRGRQHRVQMTTPPGDTITVNRNGEPRG